MRKSMQQQIEKTLVTGANGFIGRYVMAELTGRSVPHVGVTRSQTAVEGQETLALGTLDKATNWDEHLHGVSNIMHLAGRAHILNETESDPRAAFMSANVDATMALAKAAKNAGAKRFVFLSSIAVYSPEHTHLDQGTSPNPKTNYGHSKWAAEQELAHLQDENFHVLSLRPPLVFGPHVSANFKRLLSLAWSGLPLPLAGVQNERSMIYAANLAALITACLQTPDPLSGAYLVSDPERISTPQLLKTLSQSMDRPDRFWSLPDSMMGPIVRVLGAGGLWNKLNGTLTIDGSALWAELDTEQPFSLNNSMVDLREALNITGEWYAATKR